MKKKTKTATALLTLLVAIMYQGYKEIGPSLDSQAQETAVAASTSSHNKRISIMTYNVENLFDTLDDPKKNDETFLPKKKKNKAVQKKCRATSRGRWLKDCLNTNWTTYMLSLKMKRLASVIKSYKGSKGSSAGPDILLLQEVENLSVLKDFNKKHLGYPNVILLEGPDRRGIDTAILSRLPSVKKPKLHLQKIKSQKSKAFKATRGILEAFLKLPNGETLNVYSIHFPSQGSPTSARKQAISLLNKIAGSNKKLSLVGGDFNITSKEDKSHKIFTKTLSKKWSVSHLIGCEKCKGSNYYHRTRSWSFFDALLFSHKFGKTWKIDTKSINVFHETDVQENRFGSPARFDMGKHKTGVSDHWPVVAEIYLP